jgi:hypothetical protein
MSLGDFSEEALLLFQHAAAEQLYEFSEGETYDFTRCIRSDGSAYGTGGTCRKGTEGEAKSKDGGNGEFGSFDKLTQDQRDRRIKQQAELVRDLKKDGNADWKSERGRLDRMLDKDKEVAAKKPEGESEQALGKVKIVSPDTAKKMSDAELKSQVENANKAAFGKGSKVSPEVMKGLKEQHDIAINELASRTKSKESGEQPKITATPGMAAKVKAAKEKLKAEIAANGGKRTDRIQEERRLEQNRKQREMDQKLKANQKRQEEMLRDPSKN